MRCKLSLLAVLALGIMGVAAPANATTSSCANQPGSPTTDGLGDLINSFTCSLYYNDASSYSIDLTPLLTQGGADLFTNLLQPGYIVVMNGDPNVVSVGDTVDAALYNQSLWDVVLFWPGDQNGGYGSGSVSVYGSTAYPAASVVQTFDENIFGPGSDSAFFVESTGFETVYAPGADVYDIFTAATSVPEPSTLSLFGAGLLGFAGFALYRRRKQSGADLAA